MKKLLILATAAFISQPALAAPANMNYSDYLTVGAGYFDVLDSDFGSGAVSLEYMGRPILWEVVRPVAGALVNTDGGIYGGAGFAADFSVGDSVYITPKVMVGAYDEGDDSKDLGGPVEFKSSIELAYELQDRSRIGLSVAHISNAGIYDDNPGTELIMLNYSFPMGN